MTMISRYLAGAALAALSAVAALAQSSPACAQSATVAPARSQEEAIAAAPLPYRVETVAFDNPAAPGVTLVGTLTRPNGNGPFPAVVLVAGSGRNARDEEFGNGHKPLLVLADALTRAGYAVLRYDKRGIGQSNGNYNAATTLDFASDADAAIAYMRTRVDVDPKRLGVIGHSEGSNIAATVAAKDHHVGFVVMLAANALPGKQLVAEQNRRFALADGVAPDDAAQAYTADLRFYDAITEAKDTDDAQMQIRTLAADPTLKATPAQTKQALHFAELRYMQFMLTYDPRPVLRALRVPALELHGSKDLIGPPDLEVPALREALAQDPDATVVELPGLNHFFQHADTGTQKEFATIEETIAPEVLATITDWLAKHAK